MIRSFHYAAMTTLIHHEAMSPDDVRLLEPWLEAWYIYVSGSYLKAYLNAMKGSGLIPEARTELEKLLCCFLVQKVVSELDHELSTHNSITISMRGIKTLLRECSSP